MPRRLKRLLEHSHHNKWSMECGPAAAANWLSTNTIYWVYYEQRSKPRNPFTLSSEILCDPYTHKTQTFCETFRIKLVPVAFTSLCCLLSTLRGVAFPTRTYWWRRYFKCMCSAKWRNLAIYIGVSGSILSTRFCNMTKLTHCFCSAFCLHLPHSREALSWPCSWDTPPWKTYFYMKETSGYLYLLL